MATVEILAIMAIFLSGVYAGFKIKSALLSLKEYIRNRKELN